MFAMTYQTNTFKGIYCCSKVQWQLIGPFEGLTLTGIRGFLKDTVQHHDKSREIENVS